ncbi:MAG: hypothetical protein ABW252_17410 [Polyangiales bacterium]
MRLSFGPLDDRPGRVALAFAAVIGLVACFTPLLGTYGPESALLLALTLSPWAAGLAARDARDAVGVRTESLLARAIVRAWWLLLVPVVLIALNSLRGKACDPLSGLRFIALGPLCGTSLAAVLGTGIGSTLERGKLPIVLAALLPLFEVARATYDFIGSPTIFAFAHFAGYFPGTFYDRQVDVPAAWLTHRLLGLAIAVGVWALLSAGRDPDSGRVAAARLATRPLAVLMAALLAVASIAMVRDAHARAHASRSASITERLGQVVETKRCRAVVPRELPRGDAARLAEDCEFRITQIERLLAVQERERITAFFFRSPQEKRQLMGAARVYIAKPWRREVYLQLGDHPHPVLAHELGHVVARHASRGPFGVPGRLFGLIPEPTLVEGMAVALEPHARDELTPHQWAKAAHAEKLAPPLASLLGASFFGTNQALAYTLAGSFLRYVLDTKGPAVVRKVYALGSVEDALGQPFATLERDWKTFLATVPLPPRAAALARLKFERAGVFSQVCPHQIEELENGLSAALGAGDLPGAAGKCREVLAVDPRNTGTRATLAGVLARSGDERAATAELSKLEAPPRAPTPTIARARMALADAAFARGQLTEAEAGYRALLDAPQPEAELRQLDVRLLAIAASEPSRSLLRELLVGEPFRNGDMRTAMHVIRDLREHRDDGLPLYLEARQLAAADRPDLAQRLLREALARGLPSARLRTEALKMQVRAAYASGSLSEAEAIAVELARRDDATLAEQEEARDWRARIAFRRASE